MKILFGALLVLVASTTGTAQDIYNRARSSLSAGDTAKAVSGFQEALRAGQKVGESNYYLGIIALARGKTDEAVGFLSKAADLEDDNVSILRAAGDAHLAKGDVQAALPMYRKAAKLAPADPDIAAAYGTALLEADSIDAAIVRLSSASVLNPESASLHVALGDAYMKQNVTALAITNYQKGVELDQKDVKARMKLASAFEKERKWTDAVNVYREIQKLDSTKAEAYFQEGRIWFKAKRYKDAVVPLKKYVTFSPKSVEGMSLLAQSAVEAKDPAAPTYTRSAIELDSASVVLRRMHFYALVDTKDFAGADKALAELQKRDTLQVSDYLRIGSLNFENDREEEALSWYLKAIKADSTNCEPYFNLGSLYMRRQAFDTAAVMFEKKIACEPKSLSALLNCGICYLTLKDFPASRQKLLAAVELKPDYDVSRLWLARYYSQVDSLDQAVEQYDIVLKQVEGNPAKKKVAGEAHYLKGFAYFVKLKFDPALDSFRKALTNGYETDNLHLMMGQSTLQTLNPTGAEAENQAKTAEAVKAFRRCIAMNPNNAEGHYGLGDSLIRSRVMGADAKNKELKAEACAEFQKSLKLNPNLESAKKAMELYGC